MKSYLLTFWLTIINLCNLFGQPAPDIFIEADKLAQSGDYKNAFGIISSELNNNKCKTLGYYWWWCLQNNPTLENLKTNKFTFNTPIKSLSKNAIAVVFQHQFATNQYISSFALDCKSNGIANKAAGAYYMQLFLFDLKNRQYLDSVSFFLQRALKSGSYDTFTLFNYAKSLELRSFTLEAIYYYLQCYKIDDSHYQSLLNIAGCYGQISQWDSSIFYAKKVYKYSLVNYELASASRFIGISYQYQEKNKLAKYWLKQSVEIYPNDPYNHQAYISFVKIKSTRKARKLSIKYLNKFSASEENLNWVKSVFESEKDYQKVLKQVSK